MECRSHGAKRPQAAESRVVDRGSGVFQVLGFVSELNKTGRGPQLSHSAYSCRIPDAARHLHSGGVGFRPSHVCAGRRILDHVLGHAIARHRDDAAPEPFLSHRSDHFAAQHALHTIFQQMLVDLTRGRRGPGALFSTPEEQRERHSTPHAAYQDEVETVQIRADHRQAFLRGVDELHLGFAAHEALHLRELCAHDLQG